ncbi:uncharacterized protein LOC111707468 [Eurytemora carolleeae]|uniref:uncharacterized protein LOC111707468 n=1 Tax=Eurytemora carolleeae TaxID=1294199 RepID=UPI000C76E2DC|nr:uncharacterized protein LOC111707468 [Eurytemora carolleeae]|eukprot:XP_023336347.1 uncharacterized protein LOC111707468 [Eurytemora affinis]
MTGGDGCDYNPGSNLFTTIYPDNNSAINWTWSLPGVVAETVLNNVGWPTYSWMPDGHLSTLKDSKTGEWIIFYPNHESFRTTGQVPLPDKSRKLSPPHKIAGGKLSSDAYNNGGMWLMSAHLSDPEGSMVGFFHTEDQYPGAGGMAFKSVALGCSKDFGVSWVERGRIITVGVKPVQPAWSGTGDQDVIWDWKNKRWYMGTSMSAAVNYNMNGEMSGWKKWNGTAFSRNSLVEDMEPLRDFDGKVLQPGGNPSLHWNKYLELWVMVYHGWNGNIYITTSRDLPFFNTPRILVARSSAIEKNWYPTLLSWAHGDRLGGRSLYLYYRLFPQGPGGGISFFKKTELKLCRDSDCDKS